MVLWEVDGASGVVLKDELMRVLMGVCSWWREEEMVVGNALFAVFRVFRKSWVAAIWVRKCQSFGR